MKKSTKSNKLFKYTANAVRANSRKPINSNKSTLRNRLQMLRWRYRQMSRSSRLGIFIVLFGLVGIATMLYSLAADQEPRMPSGNTQLVLSYQIGMPHLAVEGEFPTGMPPSMLLYGNGLMLCGQTHDNLGGNNTEPLSFTERQLDRESMQKLYSRVLSMNFYDIADIEQSDEYVHPTAVGRFIRLNTTQGSSTASVFSDDDSPKFADIEQLLRSECEQANKIFDPDDIVVETIKIADTNTDLALPAGVPSDSVFNQTKSRRVRGQEAKDLKQKLSRQTKIFKADDGSIVKARYLPKVPEYEEPKRLEDSKKGRVEAATTSQTRWLYVVALDQLTPSNASSTVSEHASSIRNYYYNQTSRYMSNVEVDVVKGTKTASQYRTCPIGENCGGYVSLAVYYNLQNEFKLAGNNTNILQSFDGTNGCIGWGTNSYGMNQNNSNSAYGFAVTTLAGCTWYNGSHGIAAHEAGHGFALNHTCDATLMDGCGYSKPAGLSAPLNSNQATFLRNNSPFFNWIIYPVPTVTLTVNGTAGNITLTTGKSLTVAWSATENPTNCIASGSWSGVKSASGSENRTIDTLIPGTKTYQLSCSNAHGTGTKTRTVTVKII